MTSSDLTLAISSSGALYDSTLEFLNNCGLEVNRPNKRRYIGEIPALAGVSILFQRSADITWKVEEGNADLGIVGYDRYLEFQTNPEYTQILLNNLGFGACSLAFGVPESWFDVSSIADLAEVATDFKRKGLNLKIASKFPRLTEHFLISNSISNFSIVPSSGTLEIAPEMGSADIITDITSTGTTMKANKLKTISGGIILNSESCLIVNSQSISDQSNKLAIINQIVTKLQSYLSKRVKDA